MTSTISSLVAAAAVLVAVGLFVRLAGQFITGHVLQARRWFRDRSRG